MIAIGDSQILSNFLPGHPVDGMDEAPYPINLVGPVRSGVSRPLDKAEQLMSRRHEGKWNMVFCDGHVEHGGILKFFDFAQDEVARRWNRDNSANRN
jgi:prepilin-type processing-associated H-X9-DG protein